MSTPIMNHPQIERAIEVLTKLDGDFQARIDELEARIKAQEAEIRRLEEAAADPDEMDNMETIQISKAELKKRQEREESTPFNAIQAKKDARSLQVIGRALSKLGASSHLRETTARAVRYHVKARALESLQQLMEGLREVEGDALGNDGRKLADSDLLDDTQSGIIGIGGAAGITLKSRRLNVGEKYRHILLACLRHYLDSAIDEKLENIVSNIAVSVEDQLRGLVPDLPRD